MKIPKSLKIGYHDYQIVEWGAAEVDLSGSWGQCDKHEKTIYICTDTKPAIVADIFIHECMHAIWDYFNLEDSEDEEKAVSVLSSGLVDLFVSNPKALQWVTEQIGSKEK